MNETQRNQIKGALLKCAEENENRPIFTGYVVVSSVCKSAVERIEELEVQNEKMKCCGNCKGVCDSDEVAHFCKNNDYKLWEIRK